MSFSLIYVISNFFKRIASFVYHWYVESFFISVHWIYNILESLEHFFALRITFYNWAKPLYQDYSIIGYVLGFVFRTFRILISGLIYLIILILAVLLFLAWSAVLPFIIYQIITNFNK